MGTSLGLAIKQSALEAEPVNDWIDRVWSRTFGATSQAILKSDPFEFSPSGISDIDQEALRSEATEVVRDRVEREGIDLTSSSWEKRAMEVLVGFLNQKLQEALGIEFYVWATQHDLRVREGHAERDDKIFRWDTPPLHRDSRNPATADDIPAEYELLDAMVNSEGYRADYYAQFTGLVLSQGTIEILVHEYIHDKFKGLLNIFPGFGNFPVSAQVAIWDMVYNLGLGGFERKFSKLQDAIRAGDWESAAEESERDGVGQERNDYVYNLFIEAANEP